MKKFGMGFPWPTEDPFLFCAHHNDQYPPGNSEQGIDRAFVSDRALGSDFTLKNGFRMYHGKSVPGFPYHPHCGFETITLVTEGYIDHSDSLGAKARFGKGDVQWMTAGSGVQHSEMFPLLDTEKSNKLELFQIWLNLPKASKYVDPHFDMIWDYEVPKWKKEGVFTRLIYGSHGGFEQHKCPPNSWAVHPENQLVVAQFILDPGATLSLDKVNVGISRNLYLYDGEELIYDEGSLTKNEGLQIEASERVILTNSSKKEAYLILMQGKPINEPVAKYGPFVMNESHEIESVIAKYRITEFGGWPWPKAEMTHGSDPIRFATYPDQSTIYAEK